MRALKSDSLTGGATFYALAPPDEDIEQHRKATSGKSQHFTKRYINVPFICLPWEPRDSIVISSAFDYSAIKARAPPPGLIGFLFVFCREIVAFLSVRLSICDFLNCSSAAFSIQGDIVQKLIPQLFPRLLVSYWCLPFCYSQENWISPPLWFLIFKNCTMSSLRS